MEAQSDSEHWPQTTPVDSTEELGTGTTKTSKNATKSGRIQLHNKVLPMQSSPNRRLFIKCIPQTWNASEGYWPQHTYAESTQLQTVKQETTKDPTLN